jgi:hypothetical protein
MKIPGVCALVLPFFQNHICKMLVVKPVDHADVPQCMAIRVAALGSLVIGRPPPYPGYVEEAEAAIHANLDDPDTFVRHLKVVDPADEAQVMAYAKWELYPDGRSKESLEKLMEPISDADKSVDQYGHLREAAHEYFCTRNREMGKHPHLRTLRSPHSPVLYGNADMKHDI